GLTPNFKSFRLCIEVHIQKAYLMAMIKSIYLDFNATGIATKGILAAVDGYLKNAGNPSSVHHRGRDARAAVDDAREAVAALVGVKPSSVVFTSGGTEANNQALRSINAKTLIISSIEHDSTIGAAYASGKKVIEIPVNAGGVVDLEALKAALKKAESPVIVSVMIANNETGVIQPIKEIAAIAHQAGALMHTDAIQAAGRIPVDFYDLGVDMMSLSGHKLGGLTGAGALVFKPSVKINPLILGGGQEFGWRSGTENVPGIVAFGAAAEEALVSLKKDNNIKHLRDELEAGISMICPEMQIFGRSDARLDNTSNIAMPGVGSETQVMAFDLEGICISAGAACSSGKVRTSHVLIAMGVAKEIADCAIRVSLGWTTSEADIAHFITVWEGLYERTHQKLAGQ
ncbi:MAG: cysteine desulfurase family protein, partial [Alphaproteobacteria bacterium]